MAKKKSANKLGCPELRKFKLGDIKIADYNPRVISEEALAGLAASLSQFGCVEPIVVNVWRRRNVIVGGNQRYNILQAMGVEECVCVVVKLNPAREKTLNLALNNPQIQGEFIAELDAYIDRLHEEAGDDQLLLDLRIDKLRSEIEPPEKEGLTHDDDIPKPPKDVITRSGDLWLLGDHRLLCGDSTNPDDVKRLMDGNKASLFATDPPYCVDYTGKERPNGGKDWSKVFKDHVPNFQKFLYDFYSLGLTVIKNNSAMYLWHSHSKRREIDDVAEKLGILIHQQIIWVKPCVVFTFCYYSWRHEPCLLMWVKGKKPKYKFEPKAISTVWPVGYVKQGDPNTPEYYTDVWELDWGGKKRNPGIEHPTVKPVEVFAIPMRVHTKPGDICYEPFSGSGSQIIAAEKLGRRCFAMELVPFFCDVAVKRWEQWTGKKAKQVSNGKNRKTK